MTFKAEEIIAMKQAGVNIAEVLNAGQKQNLVPPHGNEVALLNDGSVNRDLYSAMPRPGVAITNIPIVASRYKDQIFQILTGQTAPIGVNPEPDTCSDLGVVAGNLKTCKTSFQFGEFRASTKPFDIMNAAMLLDQQDMDNFTLNNRPFATNNPFLPSVVNQAQNINSPLGKNMIELGYQASQGFEWMHINGNSTRTGATAYAQFPREYNGLLQLIRTGYTDLDTGEPCPAADSYVVDAGNTVLGEATVAQMIDVYRRQVQLAADVGLGVTWGWMMHPALMYQIFDVWACNYATVKCETTDANGRRFDVTNVREMADTMRNGMYLTIDGVNVPITFTYGITPQLVQNQYYTSPMLLVAYSANGTPLITYEYLPLNQEYVNEYNQFGDFRVLNNGFYFMNRTSVDSSCVQFTLRHKGRLIHRAPFLSAKIENVLYQNEAEIVSPYRGDAYYRNGGQYKYTA